MKNKTNDLWLNIYTFILLPFCVIINVINLYKYIRDFGMYDNPVISVFLILFAIISIVYYSVTVYFAKDRVRIAYNLLLVSVGLSVVIASYNQVIATYLDQGLKFYMMFVLYGVLFTIFWGLPNYLYIIKRRELFKDKQTISQETKDKLKEELKKSLDNKKK